MLFVCSCCLLVASVCEHIFSFFCRCLVATLCGNLRNFLMSVWSVRLDDLEVNESGRGERRFRCCLLDETPACWWPNELADCGLTAVGHSDRNLSFAAFRNRILCLWTGVFVSLHSIWLHLSNLSCQRRSSFMNVFLQTSACFSLLMPTFVDVSQVLIRRISSDN